MYFEAKWAIMQKSASQIGSHANTVRNINTQIKSIRATLPMVLSSSASGKICNDLQTYIGKLEDNSNKLRNLSNTLSKTANLYKATEKKLLGMDVDAGSAGGASSGGGGAVWGNDSAVIGMPWISSHTPFDLREYVGNAGVIGSGISLLWGIIAGESILENSKMGMEFLNDAAEFTKKTAFFADTSKLGNVVQGVGVFAQWAGGVLTVVDRGLRNWNEYQSGEISGVRAVFETGVESALLIGTAAVIAGIGALPVTIIAVTAVWVADGVCRMVTNGEKDLAEVVSDLILDVGEAALDAGKNIAEGVSTAWNTIVGWFTR